MRLIGYVCQDHSSCGYGKHCCRVGNTSKSFAAEKRSRKRSERQAWKREITKNGEV